MTEEIKNYFNPVSASKLKTYLHCPFKFVLNYLLGIKSPPSFATENGKLIHSVLEGYGLNKRKYWELALFAKYKKHKPWIYHKNFDHDAECVGCQILRCIDDYHGFIYTDIPEKVAIDMFHEDCPIHHLYEGRNLINKILKRIPSPFENKIIDAEKAFDLDIGGGVRINGVIDLIIELDKDTIEIRDWKTGNWTPKYEEALEDPQLRMYDIAVSMLYPQYKNRLLTFDYIKNREYTFVVSDDEREFNRRWIISTINKMIADVDPVRNLSFKCKYFCLPTVCDSMWPKKRQLIKEIRKL